MAALNLHVSIGAQMTETFRKRLHIEKKAAQKLSMEALKKVHLTDSERVYRAYPGQLSGGMLQRSDNGNFTRLVSAVHIRG